MRALRIAQEKVEFRPAGLTDNTCVLALNNLVFEPLCRWQDGLVHPGLFARWSHADGGRSWRFFVRDKAVFHDGKPCEAEDILNYIEGVRSAIDSFGVKWPYSRYLADVRFSVMDKRCLGAESPAPIADILDIFTDFFICRMAPDGSPVLGTGRYRVADYQHKTALSLDRVGDGDDPAKLVVKAYPDAAARYAALKANEVDVAVNLERMDGKIDYNAAYRWIQTSTTMSVTYFLNCMKGPFASPDARRAVNHAVNSRLIIDELFHGLGVPAATVVSAHHLGFKSAAISPIPYDIDKAKALFEQAGVSDEILIRTPTHMPERAVQISTLVKEALSLAGVKATLDVQHDRPEYAREVSRKHIGDMAIFDSTPHSTYRILNDDISSAQKAEWWQGYRDDAAERMIRDANASVTPDDRERSYGKCLARLNANPPWLYLYHPVEVLACKKDVSGVSLDHLGSFVISP